MTPSEREFVKRELQKTGYPLEDKVASILSELLENCDIEPNYYYTDWQTEDSRELDLKVTYEVTSRPITIEYIFLIECKRLPGHVWAFIESRQRPFLFKDSVSIWDHIEKIGRQEPVVEILKSLTKLDEIECDIYSHRFKEIILDAKKSNKRGDNIRSATIGLAKAMYYEQKRDNSLNKMLRENIKRESDYIRIYYPLIVFEGKMYGAKMLPDVDPRRISSAHLHHFSLQKGKEMEMIIDVVGSQSLRDFIRDKFLLEVNMIRKKEAKLRNSYLELIKRLMLSEKRYLGPA